MYIYILKCKECMKSGRIYIEEGKGINIYLLHILCIFIYTYIHCIYFIYIYMLFQHFSNLFRIL